MIKQLIIGLCVGACALSACTLNKTEVKKKHNIIFLMDDQHRWDALGVVNKEVHTPNLDALADAGVRYESAVCQAPMCIASRYSMMLGVYPNQCGILRNQPGIPDSLLPAKPLAQVLKENGYETAGFGKTHWAIDCSTRGFETRYIGECFEEGAVMMKDQDPERKQRYDDEVAKYGPGEENNEGYIGETSQLAEVDHRDGWVTNECLKYLKRREDERPLFLYLSFLKPHAGHNVPQGFEDSYNADSTQYATQPDWASDNSPHAEGVNRRELYEGFWKNATPQQWREMTMRYYANCTWLDDMFGRVLKQLEEKHLLDNAIIVYVSDHGEMLGERYYRFNKYCLYDASVRVPMIISGTALPEAMKGVIDTRNAELTDVYPTLLQAAGVEIPANIPGEDLLGIAKRPANFCALHERREEAAFMWRTPQCKLILRMNRKQDASQYEAEDIIGGEFYDLVNDEKEWYNLYDDTTAFKNEKQKMTDELLAFLKTQKRL